MLAVEIASQTPTLGVSRRITHSAPDIGAQSPVRVCDRKRAARERELAPEGGRLRAVYREVPKCPRMSRFVVAHDSKMRNEQNEPTDCWAEWAGRSFAGA